MDETFSSIDLVTQCLLDEERTRKFEQAINAAVGPDSVVLDVGTGSGILALFAARAGAKKVFSIEFDPFVAKLAHENIQRNGYGDVVQVMLGDARNIRLPEGTTIDVVTMEMLTTGMVDEFQIWALNRLFEKGYVDEKTVFIPCKEDTSVLLTETNFYDFGFNMRMVKHFWKFLPKPKMKRLSDPTLLDSVLLNKSNLMEHHSEHIIKIKKTGTLNSIYLQSSTWLNKKTSIGDTLALNGPVCVPLDSDIEVTKKDRVQLIVDYQFGNGFRNFKVFAKKL